MIKIILVFFMLLVNILAKAQFLNKEPDEIWRKYRKEFFIGGGGTQFLGDLGGNDGPGKKFGLGDINWWSTTWQLHTGFKYQISPLFSTSSTIYIGKLKGSDFLTSNIKRFSRELETKTFIFEVSQRAEFIFYSSYKKKEKKVSNLAWKRLQAYVFSGVGVFYYQPKGYSELSRSWYLLQPLKTEGQGYPGSKGKSYKRISMNIPFGFGIQKSISKRRSIKLELIYNKTFTDYLDDVSTNYYIYNDPAVEQTPPRPETLEFADPTGQWAYNEYGATYVGQKHKHGEPRGGKGKDCYFYASFSFVKALGLRKELKEERRKAKDSKNSDSEKKESTSIF